MDLEDNELEILVPFYIDHSELNGIYPDVAFILGFEYSQYIELLKRNIEGEEMTCHIENKDRILKAAEIFEKQIAIKLDDKEPDWIWIKIA